MSFIDVGTSVTVLPLLPTPPALNSLFAFAAFFPLFFDNFKMKSRPARKLGGSPRKVDDCNGAIVGEQQLDTLRDNSIVTTQDIVRHCKATLSIMR